MSLDFLVVARDYCYAQSMDGGTMKHPYRRSAHRAIVASQLATVLVAGCHSWHVSEVTPAQLIGADHPKVVRIERVRAGGRIDIAMPEIRGETLYGRVAADTVAIPIGEIRLISVKRVNPAKSILTGLGALGVAIVAFFAFGGSY